MTEGMEHLTDPDDVAEGVGVIIRNEGSSMPASYLRLSRLTPPGDGAFNLVAITSWLGQRGLYTLFTPQGARKFAASLLELAERADAINAERAAEALSRATGRTPE